MFQNSKPLQQQLNKRPSDKTLRQLKEYDTIEVAELLENIDFEKSKDVQLHGLLPEFILKFATNARAGRKLITYAYFNESTNVISCYLFSPSDSAFFQLFTADMKDSSGAMGGKVNYTYLDKSITPAEATQSLMQIIGVWAHVLYELQQTKTVIKTERTRKSSSPTPPTSVRRKTAKVLNADKVVYDIKYAEDSGALKTIRKYSRHVGAWGVVGHSRTLASGKTIWVKPYTKGEGKREVQKYIVK